MRKEIEVKILNIDRERLRATLKKLGARQVLKPTLMRELYLESPVKERVYSSFRLRAQGKNSFLTLKLKKGEDKKFEIRDELEVEVDDFNAMRKILRLAGFTIFRQREKIREEYQLGKIKVEIDEYPKMKPYMEIEAFSKKEIKDFLKKIGFPLEYTTSGTATEIIQNAGVNPDYLLFWKKK